MDLSSVGKLRATGADCLDLLHRLSTNHLAGLKPFTAAGTVFTTDKGRIVDFVRVWSLPDSLLLITSPSLEGRLKGWIDKYTIMEDLTLADVTPNWVMYSIIGPEAAAAGRKLLDQSFSQDCVIDTRFAGSAVVVGFERSFATDSLNILVPHERAEDVWKNLSDAVRVLGYGIMGESGYEVFRIFQGIPRENRELTESYNPYEVGLSPWISTTKGCYIGQEVIARLETYDKVQRKLVRISFTELLPLESDRSVLSMGGDAVGNLTSFSRIPVKGGYFGIGVVKKNTASIGNTMSVPNEHTESKGVVTEVFDRSNR